MNAQPRGLASGHSRVVTTIGAIFSFASFGAIGVVACSLGAIDLRGKACPCGVGYVCVDAVCLREGELAADSSFFADAGGTETAPSDHAVEQIAPKAPPSCVGLSTKCAGDDCCASDRVAGGTFLRGYDKSMPAPTDSASRSACVPEFFLDRYEVTVARFRTFLLSTRGIGSQQTPPTIGVGAHPLIANSGWRAEFEVELPPSEDALSAELANCRGGAGTYTKTPGPNESAPINCVRWSVAFAFCAWDGGRLPTEAEWNYAAAGGDEQRVFPWSNPPQQAVIQGFATIGCAAGSSCIEPVGSHPNGRGRFGQFDLTASVYEPVIDFRAGSFLSPCCNPTCAVVDQGAGNHERMFRGGSFARALIYQPTSYRQFSDAPAASNVEYGIRCARDR